MLVFSGTVLGVVPGKIQSLYNITAVVDVFIEILIYRIRSSFVKGGKGEGGGGGGKKHPVPPK